MTEQALSTGLIATPDRRLRVFVSSTLEELAQERRAVRAAIAGLRLTPVMFEIGARPHPPRDLYRAYLAQSDVFVGVYGDRYGWVAPDSDISGLEEELRLSTGLPRLLYVRTPAPDRDPRLTALIEQIWDDATTSTKPYATTAELAELVADDLAVLLTERFTSRSAALPGLSTPSYPVPQTALVDRRVELQHVLSLLHRRDVRIVALVGPGGVGKTRLALEAAAAMADEDGGVWFVDLAPVAEPGDVATAMAAALGVHAEGTRPVLDLLADRLGGGQVLLVLDNFEHVLAAAADVGRLVRACPRVRALVTSRSVLHLRGEHDVLLGRLPLPAGADLDSVAASPAVELLVERAQQIRPDFALTERNAAALAEVARRMEGVPLALELAAARLRLLSPAALLARLDDRLGLRSVDVDAPSRQQTLRATIDWSHDLLAPPERALLARLSVCVGGCTLEAAERIGAVDRDVEVLDTLGSLVGHSLVAVDEHVHAEPRFRMLESVRSYAAERLSERGEVAAVERRFADHMADFAEQAGDGLTGAEHRLWTARIDDELDNLRAALRWSLDADEADRAVRLAAPLSRYWWSRGLLVEMLGFAEATAGLPSAAGLAPDAAARLLWARGAMRIALGRVADATPLLARLVDDARELDDDVLLGHALTALAMTDPQSPDVRDRLEEAVTLFRRSDDTWAVAYALMPLGHVALLDDDVLAARTLHLQALDAAEQIDDDHLRAQVLDQLGVDAVLSGDLDQARDRLATAAGLHRAQGDREGLANCLDALAALALLSGDAALAARLGGAAARTRQVVGLALWPLVEPLSRRLADAVDSALGEQVAARERAAGAELPALQALDLGLVAVGCAVPTG